MTIKTTLNVHKKILERIESASENSGLSKSEIITMLLMKVMKNDAEIPAATCAVKYQEKDCAEMWKKLHVSLREDEYEYFTDLRNFLKQSLSRIVANAVKKYLDNLFTEKKSDNSHFSSYILAKESANGVIYWKIFWGLPKNIEKFLNFN